MAPRSLAIACSTSLRSVVMLSSCAVSVDQIFVGLQVDAAEAFAISLESGQLAVDIGERRNDGVRREGRNAQAIFRRDFERLANAARFVLAALAGAFKPRLDAGVGFARFRHVFLRGAQRLRCGAHGVFGCRQRIGGVFAFGFDARQFRQQRVALLGDFLRQAGEGFEFGFGLGHAALQSAVSCSSALV